MMIGGRRCPQCGVMFAGEAYKRVCDVCYARKMRGDTALKKKDKKEELTRWM